MRRVEILELLLLPVGQPEITGSVSVGPEVSFQLLGRLLDHLQPDSAVVDGAALAVLVGGFVSVDPAHAVKAVVAADDLGSDQMRAANRGRTRLIFHRRASDHISILSRDYFFAMPVPSR